MFPHHDHAAYSCNMLCSMNNQRGDMDMKYGHAAWTYNMDMQQGHAARISSMDKQHAHAEWRHGHERGHEIYMLNWLPIFQPRPSLC